MIVVTHSGKFHADEVAAYTILRVIYPDINVIRSRDQDVIDNSDIVIDVGQVYDPLRNRFDHHQRGCDERFNINSMISMSSAGMVYKTYGRKFLEKMTKTNDLEELFETIYFKVIQEIDALDNGMKQSESKLNYYINSGVTSMVSKMNGSNIYDHTEQMTLFKEASDYILQNMKYQITYFSERQKIYHKDRIVISDAMKNRFDISETGEILKVDSYCHNGLTCIIRYEQEHFDMDEKNIKFIIYPSEKGWMVLTISKDFVSRKKLMPINDLQLLLSDPEKLIFVHNKLFIASATDLNTAIEIAQLSL
jgi:uncharacterized UPF0160 family protein